MRLKSWIVFCTLFAACLPALAQEFRGKAIFSVEVLEGAFDLKTDGSKGPKGRTGVFCYHEEDRTVPSAPPLGSIKVAGSLSCYKLRDEKSVGVAGPGSSESAAILQTLRSSSLSAFNVQNEIDTVSAKIPEKIVVKDGAKFRIQYDFNGVSIDHTGWNPGPYIRFLAPHSDNLRKLDEVINIFATLYGRREFGL